MLSWGSTPKNRSLADSSTCHTPWRTKPSPSYRTFLKPQHLSTTAKPHLNRWTADEDINTSATIISFVEILGPITRSQAQQLNHQVNSFLCSSAYNIERWLLPNDLIVHRNQGKDHRGQTEHQEGAGEKGDVHKKVANQYNSELTSSSPTQSPGPPHIQINV
jgi:hypothetical protein